MKDSGGLLWIRVLNFGVIGAGRIGKVHTATLTYRHSQARVLAIADINLAAAEQVAAQFDIPEATADPARSWAIQRSTPC